MLGFAVGLYRAYCLPVCPAAFMIGTRERPGQCIQSCQRYVHACQHIQRPSSLPPLD